MKTTEPVDPTDVVVQALAVELKTSEERVRAARSLKADLKMDSIAAVNVAFLIEEEYEIEIEIDERDSFDSVEAIVAIVRRAFTTR